jgi:hypothetical protein
MVEQVVSADIHVDGDWPSAEDLISRNKVLEELGRLQLGQFVDCSHGTGSVAFEYRVANIAEAKRVIESEIRKHFPDRTFTVDVSGN